MDARLREALQVRLGSAVVGARRVAGGDINLSYRVTLRDGEALFVKTHHAPAQGMFGCEAAGLGWLGEAGPLRTPRVIAVSDEAPAFLALEWIEPGAMRATDGGDAPHHDEALGRGLAWLHRAGAGGFGLEHDNFIALLPQRNRAHASWPGFYAAERLQPLLARAVEQQRLPGALRRDFERLFARLDALCGPPEPPARLHGDLWAGNVMRGARGEPVLIDPAVYGGHREMDLAMMRLFGGFSERCFAAYAEEHPLAAGHAERVPLYQLYPLLVHVNLFGAGYLGALERALRTLL